MNWIVLDSLIKSFIAELLSVSGKECEHLLYFDRYTCVLNKNVARLSLGIVFDTYETV